MAKLWLNLSSVKNLLSLPNDPSQPLTRFDLIRLKNWMLAGIFLANIVAKILMDNFLFRGVPLPSAESLQFVSPFGDVFRGIFFLSTDGIWEARNLQGEMFGKEPIYDIIRNNSSLSAEEILNVMTEALESFQRGAKIEDDVTLVIIKITG